MRHRSTPDVFADCDHVSDRNGTLWTYSEPADVWQTRERNSPAAPVIHTSARSWDRLLSEFGPLTEVEFRVEAGPALNAAWKRGEND